MLGLIHSSVVAVIPRLSAAFPHIRTGESPGWASVANHPCTPADAATSRAKLRIASSVADPRGEGGVV